MMFGIVPKRPEFTAYVGRLHERPAHKRSQAKNEELLAKMNVQPGAA